MSIPFQNEFFSLRFAQFPAVENPDAGVEGEYATAPKNVGSPILLATQAAEGQKWKISPGPDPKQESYQFFAPALEGATVGFSHASEEDGSPVVLGDVSDYIITLLPQPGTGGPIHVTVHPKGPEYQNKYVAVRNNQLIIERHGEFSTGIKPAWLITPDELVFHR